MRNPLLATYGKKREPPVKSKYLFPEAYRFITYEGSKGYKEVIWNSRDGQVPFIIYSKNGQYQLIKSKVLGERKSKHILSEGEYYFANTTKERAKFLARQIVKGRWYHKVYPLHTKYGKESIARKLIYKSLYGDGTCFTILRHGKDVTTYMHKHFRNFVSS